MHVTLTLWTISLSGWLTLHVPPFSGLTRRLTMWLLSCCMPRTKAATRIFGDLLPINMQEAMALGLAPASAIDYLPYV